ncbi:MAG TPA: hypothetical protein VGD67_22190 [Pseudonocardiaceae bacterium]
MITVAFAAGVGVAGAQDTAEFPFVAEQTSATGTSPATESEPSTASDSGPSTTTSTTTTTPDDEPSGERPLVSVVADCHNGYKSLGVWVDGPEGVTYDVTLQREGDDAPFGVQGTEESGGLQLALFVNPPVGEYTVTVVGSDGSTGGSVAAVESCSTLEPGAEQLTVRVECIDGSGTVFIRVANPGTGDVRTFALDIDDVEVWDGLRLSGGYFVDIVEQAFADGTYTVVLRQGEKEIDSAEFTVACAPPTTEPTTTQPVTTTTPAPQGGGTPPSGGLASTGAAVGGIAVLGLVALAIGAALVLIGRRRTAGTD